ncbi:hypothetical protein KIF59_13440 [Enterobacter cloacae subsp. cloacae]|nr:hypothetical protein [Enterobacter cloacae subsp. cloacae]
MAGADRLRPVNVGINEINSGVLRSCSPLPVRSGVRCMPCIPKKTNCRLRCRCALTI